MFQALHANGDFTFDQMHHYRMAVTEREVINGCINVENVKDHVIIYTRFDPQPMNLKDSVIFRCEASLLVGLSVACCLCVFYL